MAAFENYASLARSPEDIARLREKCRLWSGLVECIHIASLMHDDIIDHSATRRGLKAHHLVFGERATLFAGDYIIARSAKKVYELGDVRMYQIYAAIIEDLTSGEVYQAEKGRPAPRDLFERYLLKSHFKTGSLISNALRGVAQLLQLPPELHRQLFSQGQKIGLVFQMIDDILDFEGDPAILGKPILGDLAEGIVNLPAYFPLTQGSESAQEVIALAMEQKNIPAEQCKEIARLVREQRGCEKARLLATSLADELLEELDGLSREDGTGMKFIVRGLLGRQK
ncbi:uncharacterized protein LOC127594873 [Hippocampus zosterae]|uniref:uncharacterized protein LOC127594873 n=1 Tax=Hippocampus zosterae TaxID=109293 RepID=UPI00223DF58F|nr:uncharacterized protein LOC127594873 [Hippocampus zosterae]